MTDTLSQTAPLTPNEKLQLEFNCWAETGEGEKMEHHHLDITLKTLQLMDLRPGQRVLDLGCGAGWATRLLARAVTEDTTREANVVGLDVSDKMIRLAQRLALATARLRQRGVAANP